MLLVTDLVHAMWLAFTIMEHGERPASCDLKLWNDCCSTGRTLAASSHDQMDTNNDAGPTIM